MCDTCGCGLPEKGKGTEMEVEEKDTSAGSLRGDSVEPVQDEMMTEEGAKHEHSSTGSEHGEGEEHSHDEHEHEKKKEGEEE